MAFQSYCMCFVMVEPGICVRFRWGLCVYIYTSWCGNVIKVDEQCMADVKDFMLKCQPFYLPREFTCVFSIAVHILPDANYTNATQRIYEAVSKQMARQPDCVCSGAADFNKEDFRTFLPKLYHHVHISARGKSLWTVFVLKLLIHIRLFLICYYCMD